MRYEFTPAAERALATAAGWTSRADADELHVAEVLLGLLAEPECRAALLLAQCDVYPDAVYRKFAGLMRLDPPRDWTERPFSSELVACLTAAERRLFDYPRPLVLATEHILLGIVASDNEVSAWLSECGMDADTLEAEIHLRAGHQRGPLPLDVDDDTPLVDVGHGLPTDEVPEPPPRQQLAVLRVLDAAANRAGEGLRVIEDYLRFVLDDRHLTALGKAIRHDLAAALATTDVPQRHAARDTQADVGTDISLPGEALRHDTWDVVAASFKRVEQSLRSLEEFSKILSPVQAATLEQLRYRVYTLERIADITRASLERLAATRLYVIVDGRSSADDFGRLVQTLVSAGAQAIQLRDNRLSDRELLARARAARELTRDSQTLLLMNDRADLAVLSDADGVHVGQDDLTVKEARQILGPRKLVGVSTHSLDQARAAAVDGANYLGVGPTFPSGTKEFSEFTGVELLRAVAAEIRLPAFAIGGITPENLPQVVSAGFTRVAVSGAVLSAADPAAVVSRLLALLESSR